MTTKYQRQWTEFEAIKSIYEKEFEEIKFPWKVDHPPWFKINLSAGIIIEVRMTKIYPDGIPEIKITSKPSDDSFVSKEKLNELEMKLIKEANGLIGNEMCFDLIEIAREYCDNVAKKGKVSFHTEMLKTKEEKDKEAMDNQAIKLQKDEEKMFKLRKAELEELEKRIHDELKDKLVLNVDGMELKHISYDRIESGTFTFDPPIAIDDGFEVKVVTATPGNTSNGSKFKVKCDDFLFDLKIIPLNHPFLQSFGGRRPLEILLKQLKNHPIKNNENITRCFGGSIDKVNNQMFLLYESENANDSSEYSLEFILEQAGALKMQKVIEHLRQICLGLIHLHSFGITHRSLDLSSLIIKNKRIKIEDYLIRKCFADLSRDNGIKFDGYDFEIQNYSKSWNAPELISRPNLYGKKVDIWALGLLTIQMIYGIDVLISYNSFNDFVKSVHWENLPIEMKEFLEGCFNSDSLMRFSTEQLLDCKIFKNSSDIEPILIQPIIKPVLLQSSENSHTHVPTSNNNSRYLTDFEELEFLGRGGFGSVVKVRNKIDDRFYAVKKIALDPRDVEYNKKILREVTTLSRLHHERIIRYYQAWIEESIETGKDEDDETEFDFLDTTTEYSTVKRKPSETIDLSLGPKSFKPFRGLIDGTHLDFDDIAEEDSEMGDFIQFETAEITSESAYSDSSYESESTLNNKEIITQIRTQTASSSSKSTRGQVLYIQMEYCPNQTLRDLIDERNSEPLGHYLDPPEIWRLFRQIVEGLVHIHAQGMMHRDLKPSNLFLDSNGDVKIGDFGLAVTRIESISLGRSDSPMHSSTNTSKVGYDKSITGESHTQNIGTPFYVSPEQITSTSVARYNQKVDMYSLGIILIELWTPFQTGMERVQSLQKCRLPEMILPAGLEENVTKISKRLLCHDAKKRFTSVELLRSDLLPPMLEEELMEDAMRSVVQPQAPHFSRLISTIFKRVSEIDVNQLRVKDFALDVHSGNATDLGVCEETSRIKKDLIEKVFLKHGAIEVNPPLLYLSLVPSESQSYSVLDDSGQRLELPVNLTRPFARWVAQSSLQLKTLKRYSIDRVFHKISQVSGGQPYQPNEAVFDIIDDEDESGLLGLCEVVRVAFDSIKCLCPGVKNDQFLFKLNNLKLTGIVNDEKMMKIINSSKSDEPADTLIQKLRSKTPNNSETLDELSQLLKYLQKLSIPSKVKVIFDPFLTGPRPDLFVNDLVFVIMKETGRRNGTSDIFSYGGRYNQLIEEYKFPTARLEGKGPFGVGMTLLLENIPSNPCNPKKPLKNGMILMLSNPNRPSNEELFLINEIWRLGRGTNLSISRNTTTSQTNQVPTGNLMQLQVKSNSGKVRIKLGREVEEISIEDFPTRLENNEYDLVYNFVSDSQDTTPEIDPYNYYPEDVENNTNTIHYILSNPKSERSNPILREKALKALKHVHQSQKSQEIIIHELPRDLIGKLLYDPTSLNKLKMSEDQRDQVQRLNQYMIGGKKGNNVSTNNNTKTLVLYNHKDNQIDLFYR